ncbi:UDP-N-acetylglucosamine/UDP-glucose/GDP-mannose transporter [Gossypium australe]|uniref:UDP-N-acetylglucosamine/UDP-glucose/GDP-mannose transporter n=1 Tax=Gossypium australe TaxID=47621 RepID=A0A5B6UMK0_9ROSI|nr:UDP-N-acetylglucosamine/UDP-glucose/GDP-mannose transporter [Gossypium australe]
MSGLEVEEISTSTFSLERLPGKSTSSSPAVAADGSTHETFSYSKLPEETLNLSIRKLDGSSFVIEVLKSATVADLKLGVQNVFCRMPDEGPDKISWGRVWGHFCLSYGDVKLITDADLIEKYGIKDDDQLHFTRHISTKVQKVKQTVPQDYSYTPLSSSVGGELNNEEGYKDSETQKGKCGRLRSTCSKLPSLKRAGTFKNRGCRIPFDPFSDLKPTFPTPLDPVIQSTITSSICVAKNEITFCKTSCSPSPQKIEKEKKRKNLFSFQFAQHNLTSYRHLKLRRV